jgi:DNA-directed RNA polymerase specialized sigma subunit
LGKYNENEGRIEILLAKIEDQAMGGRSSLISKYGGIEQKGTGLGLVTDEEAEHRDRLFEKRVLDGALNCLEERDKAIIKLRYIAKLSAWHILELYIPEHFKDHKGRPLYISESTYRRDKRDALIKMAKNLGYFADNDWVLTAQAQKQMI